MDILWKPHIAHHLDPAKYLPIEIVNLIFSFVVYHVVELEPKDPFRSWGGTTPPDDLMAHFRDGPLILTSVSRDWYQIVVNYPPLWSTILIDQSEDDCLERIQLFLDRSGKELLDIVLLKGVELTIHLKSLLIESADRFKTLVGHSTEVVFPFIPASRLTSFESPAGFVNWIEYPSSRHRISPVSIPKCLHCVQLYRWGFNPESLIQLTSFHNLNSLVITIEPEPKDTHWNQKLRFGRLQHLQLRVSNVYWHGGPSLASPWIEWIECPLLVDLQLSYSLNREPSEETYSQLEASLLGFRYLQKLQVHINIHYSNDREADASRFQTMKPSTLTYNGNLEFVHVTFGSRYTATSAWAAAFTERFFTTFVPRTNLGWQYAQFPSPAMTSNLKTIHIKSSIDGSQSALVAPEMAKLEFPLLEELYLQEGEPKWMNLLHAPRLVYLSIEGFVLSDLRHISNSFVSRVHLKFQTGHPGSREIFLPPTGILEIGLQINDIFQLNVHPSQIQAVTINVHWNERVTCPPYWTISYISRMLGTVTNMNLMGFVLEENSRFQDPSEIMPSFIRPFVHLSHLNLLSLSANQHQPPCIDQLARHLVDPSFLPNLQSLSISEYPCWSDFFQHIQQRQIGFLTGRVPTALKWVTIRGPVHGALLEHLRESLAGKYIGLINMPPRRQGSKEWPAPPFDDKKLDRDGLLCCYVCHKAGLEIGCMIPLSTNSGDLMDMRVCERYRDAWPLNTVFSP